MKNPEEIELNKIFTFLEELISWRIKNNDANFEKEAPVLELKKLGKSKLGAFLKENRTN